MTVKHFPSSLIVLITVIFAALGSVFDCAAHAQSTAGQLRGFGDDPDELLPPGFGSTEIRFRYNRDDLDDAQRMLDRYDRNRDGLLEPREVERSRWLRDDSFEFDFNHDGRLSLTELAQREASRRVEDERDDRRRSSSSSNYSWLAERLVPEQGQSDSSGRSRSARRDTSSRDSRSIAASILSRYDRNRSRTLSQWELKESGIAVNEVDTDRDGEVSFTELDTWVFQQIDRRTQDYSDIIPDWFYEKDRNYDGQVQMEEFATEWDAENLQTFTAIDANGDGVITTAEILKSKSSVGGRYGSHKAEVLAPRARIVSEIEVDDDFTIANLQVQLSITHSYLEQLDGFLVGPDGENIELFSRVGRSDDNFEETIFDDGARESIRRGRAPFRDRYQPSAVERKQTSLSHYRGQSIRGVWTLIIESQRSDRFGILHQWSLVVTPDNSASPTDS